MICLLHLSRDRSWDRFGILGRDFLQQKTRDGMSERDWTFFQQPGSGSGIVIFSDWNPGSRFSGRDFTEIRDFTGIRDFESRMIPF
jgi:hypothetical protein